jgi:ubiquinone/menaquinone biosynthesis C-methylase UbiE
MRALWRRIVAMGFRLLYHELAWSYDLVSWLASRGLWRRWQQVALAYVPAGGRFLEVGFGAGHLLVALARGPDPPWTGRQADLARQAEARIQDLSASRQVFGLDLSPAMLRLASRRLAHHAVPVPLVRGRAEALPFASGTFDAIILTFPTPFVYEEAWIQDLARVLGRAGRREDASRAGGRLIVVEQAEFPGQGSVNRFLEWLYQVTGQRGLAPDLPSRLEAAGLVAWRETVPVDGTAVGLVVAERAVDC